MTRHRSLAYRVALRPEAVAEHFAARPELSPGGPFRMDVHPHRLVVRYDRQRPAYEPYELMPQQLWLDLDDRGRHLCVKVRVVSRPNPRGFAVATAHVLFEFAANLLIELADIRDTRRRRADERKALLDLAAATLAPLAVGSERGPFRD